MSTEPATQSSSTTTPLPPPSYDEVLEVLTQNSSSQFIPQNTLPSVVKTSPSSISASSSSHQTSLVIGRGNQQRRSSRDADHPYIAYWWNTNFVDDHVALSMGNDDNSTSSFDSSLMDDEEWRGRAKRLAWYSFFWLGWLFCGIKALKLAYHKDSRM